MRLALIVLEQCDFLDALLVAAAAERSVEPGIDDSECRGDVHGPSAKREDVGIIVFAAELRSFWRGDVCRTHPTDLVGGDRHSNTGAAHQDAEIGLARRDFFANAAREVRVVHAFIGASSAIVHIDPPRSKVLLHSLFQFETSMVRA